MRCFLVGMGIALMFGSAACMRSDAPAYHETDISGVVASTEALNPNKAILISVPGDGVYRGKSYAGSGREVAQRTVAAFSHFARRVEIANDKSQTREELLRAARGANAGYLIIPSIVHWEPRVTEWALIPAQVDVNVTVIDVETGHEVRSTLLEGRSDKLSATPDNIETMYSRLLDRHVAGLYGVGPSAVQR
jgi:hypothetical protein